MAYEHSIRRSRNGYALLLRLYPKPFRQRFAKPMEQTFNDLLHERAAEKKRLFAFALWIFLETFAGIVKENMKVIAMKNLAAGPTSYRIAIAIAAGAALLLLWFNAAVAESGDSPGLLFFGVLAALVIGTLFARFKPQGMAYALFATALAQVVVAVIAMSAWGQYAELSAFNGFFILLWVGSALLFQRAGRLGHAT
jgi:hypothetical protein